MQIFLVHFLAIGCLSRERGLVDLAISIPLLLYFIIIMKSEYQILIWSSLGSLGNFDIILNFWNSKQKIFCCKLISFFLKYQTVCLFKSATFCLH